MVGTAAAALFAGVLLLAPFGTPGGPDDTGTAPAKPDGGVSGGPVSAPTTTRDIPTTTVIVVTTAATVPPTTAPPPTAPPTTQPTVVVLVSQPGTGGGQGSQETTTTTRPIVTTTIVLVTTTTTTIPLTTVPPVTTVPPTTTATTQPPDTQPPDPGPSPTVRPTPTVPRATTPTPTEAPGSTEPLVVPPPDVAAPPPGPAPTTTALPPGVGMVSDKVASEPGGVVTLTGSGCTPNAPVTVQVGDRVIGSIPGTPDGTFIAILSLPQLLEVGRYDITISCGIVHTVPIDIVVASHLDSGNSVLALFIFFVLMVIALFRRRRLVMPELVQPEGRDFD